MPTPIVDGLAPSNTEAEEALLGCLVIDPDCRERVMGIVSHHDFYDSRNATIAKAAFSMKGDLDYMTLTDALGRPDWDSYVTKLIGMVPTSVHAETYAKLVKRDSVRRQVIAAGGEIAGKAYQETDPDAILAFVNLTIGKLDGGLHDVRSADEVVSVLYDRVQEWGLHPIGENEVRGFDMGFGSLNRITDGIEPGELLGIAGRPGTGKSALAFEIARRAALRGDKVMIFSLEMTAEAVLARWAAAMSGVETRMVKRGIGDVPAYAHAITKLSQLRNVWIDDTPGLTPQQVRARAVKKHREEGLDLIVVDHGRKLRLDGVQGENTATIEGRKTAAMKDLSKELMVAVILVLQLNRALEARADKRPQLADLRNSGEHEEELDQLLGLYRRNSVEQRGYEPGSMEAQSLKHRDGRAGDIAELWFVPQYQQFAEAETRPIESWEEEL
jgi:replicative DNA helicase